MTRDAFWEHIKKTKRKDPDAHVEKLTDRLGKLMPDEVVDFDHWWETMAREAYHWNLWAAAYLINGGCSDDGFRDFRAWLVGRGRHPYEAALKHPDSLADVLDGDPVDGFGLDAAAVRVYEAKTGMSDFYDRLDRAEKDLPPPPPEGDDWDFDDEAEMRARFPKLCHLYLTPPPDAP